MDTSARHHTVTTLPGLLAFWNFQGDGQYGWLATTGSGVQRYPMRLRRIGDPQAYGPQDWPHASAPVRFDETGPFGRALYCDQGNIFAAVERADFAGSPLDMAPDQPRTLVAWVKFTGKRHLVAGIWDEGCWDPYAGQRQFALFSGLFQQPRVIAHVSATGAASHPQADAPGSQFARRRAIDGAAFADDTWVCMAMTIDPATHTVQAWLDGIATPYALTDPVVDATHPATPVIQANPYHYDLPLYHPQAFSMIFNGYDGRTGVSEHRLHIDRDAGQWHYHQLAGRGDANTGPIRLTLTLCNQDDEAIDTKTTTCADPSASGTLSIPPQATSLRAELAQQNDEDWQPIGEPITRPFQPGAPFTLGRALGLGNGSESMDHGSQIFIDGVAVYNRVLTAEELQAISQPPSA